MDSQQPSRLVNWMNEQTSMPALQWLRLNGMLPSNLPVTFTVAEDSPAGGEKRCASPKLQDGRLYKLKEVSEAIGVSESTLRRAARAGELDFVRTTPGATSPIRILGRDVQSWLETAGKRNRVVLTTREASAVLKRAK